MSLFGRLWALLSGIGLLASLGWHLLTLFGYELTKSLSMVMVVGVFLVGFPAAAMAVLFNDRILGAAPRDVWRNLLEGAPTWMRPVAIYAGVYAVLNIVLTTGGLGSVSSNHEQFQRVGSGFAVAFYAAAMALSYSAGVRARASHCPAGHRIYPGQQSCSVCGSLPDGRDGASDEDAA